MKPRRGVPRCSSPNRDTAILFARGTSKSVRRAAAATCPGRRLMLSPNNGKFLMRDASAEKKPIGGSPPRTACRGRGSTAPGRYNAYGPAGLEPLSRRPGRRHGSPTRITDMDHRHGSPTWITDMDHRHGSPRRGKTGNLLSRSGPSAPTASRPHDAPTHTAPSP